MRALTRIRSLSFWRWPSPWESYGASTSQKASKSTKHKPSPSAGGSAGHSDPSSAQAGAGNSAGKGGPAAQKPQPGQPSNAAGAIRASPPTSVPPQAPGVTPGAASPAAAPASGRPTPAKPPLRPAAASGTPSTATASGATPASRPAVPTKGAAAGSTKAGGVHLGSAASAPPFGSSTAHGTAVPPPGANAWILHPSVPIDVRLLGAGLAAVGAALYYTTSTGSDSQSPSPPTTNLDGSEGKESGTQPSSGDQNSSEADAGVSTSDLPPQPEAGASGAPEEQTGKAHIPSDHQDDSEHQKHDGDQPQQSQGADGSGDGEPEVVDPAPLHQLFQDALSGQGYLPSAPAWPEAEGSSDEQQQPASGNSHESEEPNRTAAQPAQPDVVDERVRKAHEAVGMMKEAVAGSSGEAAVGGVTEHEAAPQGVQAEEAQASADAPLPQQQQQQSMEPPLEISMKGILGLSEDLSGYRLVQKAIQRGQGARDDWDEFGQRLKQAEVDAAVFREALQTAEDYHRAEVAEKEEEVEAARERTAGVLADARANAEAFQRALRQQEALADSQREAELHRQAAFLAAAAAEAAVRERVERSSDLDQVRIQLAGLGQALSHRSEQAAHSHLAHKLALGTMALSQALACGRPFRQELRWLQKGGQEDPLVQAALRSLPQDMADKGVPTRAQLADRFVDVERTARELSMLPADRQGLLSVTLAKVAAKLKANERNAVKEGLPGGGIDAALARTQAQLCSGQLTAAASTLEKAVEGSAAAPAVQDWVKAARSRAVADQTQQLLEAHATALASSLS